MKQICGARKTDLNTHQCTKDPSHTDSSHECACGKRWIDE